MPVDSREVVKTALDRFNAALSSRDPGIVKSFDPSIVFVGSEPGEEARGLVELEALLAGIFRSAATVQFDWQKIDASGEGQAAWFQADGAVIITSPTGENRRPYRLTGVLVNGDDGWTWRLFHGSEPWIAPAR